MRPAKSKLKLGKPCQKTTKKKLGQQIRKNIKSSWIKTEDEIFNKISYQSISGKLYSPMNLTVKKFQTKKGLSPFKFNTPKGKGILKRTTSAKCSGIKTPSKSPSAKKVRRSLDLPQSNSVHKKKP